MKKHDLQIFDDEKNNERQKMRIIQFYFGT